YIPIGLSSSNISVNNPAEKEYDFLFYGDSNSSPRRRHFLSKLQEKFSVVVYNNLFGEDMHNAIRKAKVVVNIHYYEGALLGSGLIAHSQKITVAARAMAEKKVIGHLS